MTLFGAVAAAAAPFVPADDNLVLESGLPTTDPRVRQMRALAQGLRDHPDDVAAAMRLASRQLTMGVAEADPRFVGYARGTLARWWAEDHASPALGALKSLSPRRHNAPPGNRWARAAGVLPR